VGIDESRKNGRFAEVMDFVTIGRYLMGRNNGLNTLSFHQYGCGADSFGRDYPASAEGLQTQNVSSLKD
jgi:hypothetical protein